MALLLAPLLLTTALASNWPSHHPPNPSHHSPAFPGGGPTATIDAGVVIGTTTSLPAASATVNNFLGVPFAKSPPTRFAPPEDPGSFDQPINATQWSPACIQQINYPRSAFEFTNAVYNSFMPEESEDCLYLNVYAPSTPAPADGRAVLFWIYGGALQFGDAGQPQYDGSAFASYEDVIVVTVNYRTNVFGYPSSPALPDDGHNLGFLDQRFGLQWVQNNIHAFGGSPDKVTIFGESAGSWSVDALLTSYPADSNPPFRGAICESGVISYPGSFSFQDPVPSWNALASALNCSGSDTAVLQCVRSAPATQIRTIIDRQSLPFDPVPDNITLFSDPAARRRSGNIASIPVMGGTNSQEGRSLAVGQTNTTAFLLGSGITHPDYIAQIEAAYPLADGETPYDQIARIFTELAFQCPQALWANDTAAAGIPAWRYYFNASFANLQAYPGLGVYHASEIPLVFSTYPEANATTQEYALSSFMRGAWARFAKNPMGGPGWNGVGTGVAGQVLVGAEQVEVGGVLRDASGEVVEGTWNLGLLGNRGDAIGSGVTVIDQAEVDGRCELFRPIYEAGFQW
ncbi:uncharacterized protein LTR77_010747 [Saxophila tyrrhenica]|uniref:Carboxylic ester hydrolase n=1 Tax=Saxophila tyrrhenica TaxID=1690608 RepID=A0AAV9NYD6_9PEZI|nr:hypothetical protein LTR77_010747 [Saxophila tyrrhenica]